jgi:virulence-associated protein VapD
MVASSVEWAEKAKRIFKAEMKRSGLTYDDLVKLLGEMGIEETVGSVTVKVNRGAYPAWFLFAAMTAMKRDHIRIDNI